MTGLRVADPSQSFTSALSVLSGDLNADRAGQHVVPTRKAAHADQILDTLTLDDIPDPLGVQSGFRQRDEERIAGPEHSDERVVQLASAAGRPSANRI